MSTQVATSFNRTLEKTNAWIRDLDQQLNWDNRDSAYHALRAVLHALRDRLSIGEVADLASQLPMLLKGVFYEGWRPHQEPPGLRLDDFLNSIADAFPGDASVDPEEIARAVFHVVIRHVSAGEVEDIKNSLPQPLRQLWD